MLLRQAEEVPDLIVVDAAHQDAVELQVLEARGFRRGDAVQGVPQVSPAGEVGEFLRLEGIQADVQPGDPGGAEGGGEAGELGAVGGEAEL